MTRITYGLYRAGARDAGLTLAAMADRFMPPTPFPSASAAVVRYHREDAARATRRLDESLRTSAYWGATGTPQAGWADAIRTCFRTYVALAASDTRPSFAEGLHRDLALPPHELAVYIDVVLLDPSGYVPRLVLWDTNSLTTQLAALYAAPVVIVLEAELGSNRIPHVEIWHLRTGTTRQVERASALAASQTMANVVSRLAGP